MRRVLFCLFLLASVVANAHVMQEVIKDGNVSHIVTLNGKDYDYDVLRRKVIARTPYYITRVKRGRKHKDRITKAVNQYLNALGETFNGKQRMDWFDNYARDYKGELTNLDKRKGFNDEYGVAAAIIGSVIDELSPIVREEKPKFTYNTTKSNDTNGRYTYCNENWTEDNGQERGRLYSVEIRDDGVVVTIEVEATKALKWLGISATENTYIVVGDVKTLKLTGLIVNNEIVKYAPIKNDRGWNNVGRGEKRMYKLFFSGHFPPNVTSISIIDYGEDKIYGQQNPLQGYCFYNCNINNLRKNYLSFNSESEIKRHIDQNDDGICGIYEPVGGKVATLACVKNNGEYYLIYLSSPSSYRYKNYWQIGDIEASLQRTASNIMKANWHNADKSSTYTAYVTFDGAFMHVAYSSSSTDEYLKMYPTASSGAIVSGGWTGSGFALRDGYVVTNNHVVKGASSISVVGVNGSSTEMKARVVAVDSKNDLALIKINDSRFSGFGSIPYSVRNTVAEPGTDVFVLGYPMTQYMGEEIKLTNGIISSRSGYQGDITTYQISAPVQPGNSGGPMFDTNGNLIGIVNAGIPDAENVGYAIKTSYLFNLINSQVSSSIIPNNNTLAGKSLSDKVRAIRNYVFQIKCK